MGLVLITGGAGFIGSHTSEALLKAGHRVRVLDALDPQVHGPSPKRFRPVDRRVEFIHGNVCDPVAVSDALKGVDGVYHFAAQTGVGQSMYDLRSYTETNCTGTAALLEAILASSQRIKRFILASSRAVYGEGAHRCAVHGVVAPKPRTRTALDAGRFELRCPVCDRSLEPLATPEDQSQDPISVYAWTKQQQEELCGIAARTYGLPLTILRYFNVYGSRQSLTNPYTGLVSILYARMRAAKTISLYEQGTPLRDFVHVSDVARANVAALGADLEPGAVVNVGSGQATTIEELARALGEACSLSTRCIRTDDYRLGDILACYADIRRARQLMGWQPVVGLQDGLQEFVRWAETQETVDLYHKAEAELKHHGLFGTRDRRAS